MRTILVSLIIGVVLGLLKILPDRFIKINLKFQQIGVILLLFSMGASIGANRELILNLKVMGVKALTFAVLTSIFSIFTLYVIWNRFIKRG